MRPRWPQVLIGISIHNNQSNSFWKQAMRAKQWSKQSSCVGLLPLVGGRIAMHETQIPVHVIRCFSRWNSPPPPRGRGSLPGPDPKSSLSQGSVETCHCGSALSADAKWMMTTDRKRTALMTLGIWTRFAENDDVSCEHVRTDPREYISKR